MRSKMRILIEVLKSHLSVVYFHPFLSQKLVLREVPLGCLLNAQHFSAEAKFWTISAVSKDAYTDPLGSLLH